MQTKFSVLLPSRLKALRGKKTQSAIAREIGINQQTYARWELGDRQPKLQDLSNIALHFGVSIDWLLGIPGEKLVSTINVPLSEMPQAPPSPPAASGGECPACARKDVEIERLNRIIDNLSSALAARQ